MKNWIKNIFAFLKIIKSNLFSKWVFIVKKKIIYTKKKQPFSKHMFTRCIILFFKKNFEKKKQ